LVGRASTHSYLSLSGLFRRIEAAVRLRQAAAWNEFDSGSKRDLPGRIIPVVDADIVRLFMAPALLIRYVDPFSVVEPASGAKLTFSTLGSGPKSAETLAG
jgi:hypothetical protein